jgi:two-component system chemotaxis sensor kinase CheA
MTLEAMADPLTHMPRHAIHNDTDTNEQREAFGKPRIATRSLTARQQGNRIWLEIADDARGIDLERVRLKAVARAFTGIT